MVIENLEPDTMYTFFIRARDEAGTGRAGQRGQPENIAAASRTRRFRRRTPTRQRPSTSPRAHSACASRTKWSAWTRSAERCGIRHRPRRRVSAEMSSLWDRGTRTIHLRAAQNETVGFMYLVHTESRGLPEAHVQRAGFPGPQDGQFPASNYSSTKPGTRNPHPRGPD